jgi:hypothetical protein
MEESSPIIAPIVTADEYLERIDILKDENDKLKKQIDSKVKDEKKKISENKKKIGILIVSLYKYLENQNERKKPSIFRKEMMEKFGFKKGVLSRMLDAAAIYFILEKHKEEFHGQFLIENERQARAFASLKKKNKDKDLLPTYKEDQVLKCWKDACEKVKGCPTANNITQILQGQDIVNSESELLIEERIPQNHNSGKDEVLIEDGVESVEEEGEEEEEEEEEREKITQGQKSSKKRKLPGSMKSKGRKKKLIAVEDVEKDLELIKEVLGQCNDFEQQFDFIGFLYDLAWNPDFRLAIRPGITDIHLEFEEDGKKKKKKK